MKTATSLRNHLLSAAIKEAIPYERWFNPPLQSRDLKILKPFGYIVRDEVPKQNRSRTCGLDKQPDRGMRGCFFGYSMFHVTKYSIQFTA